MPGATRTGTGRCSRSPRGTAERRSECPPRGGQDGETDHGPVQAAGVSQVTAQKACGLPSTRDCAIVATATRMRHAWRRCACWTYQREMNRDSAWRAILPVWRSMNAQQQAVLIVAGCTAAVVFGCCWLLGRQRETARERERRMERSRRPAGHPRPRPGTVNLPDSPSGMARSLQLEASGWRPLYICGPRGPHPLGLIGTCAHSAKRPGESEPARSDRRRLPPTDTTPASKKFRRDQDSARSARMAASSPSRSSAHGPQDLRCAATSGYRRSATGESAAASSA